MTNSIELEIKPVITNYNIDNIYVMCNDEILFENNFDYNACNDFIWYFDEPKCLSANDDREFTESDVDIPFNSVYKPDSSNYEI